MKFEVTITEVLKRKVYVEAETKEEAENKIEQDYWQGVYILTSDDYESTEFEAKEA